MIQFLFIVLFIMFGISFFHCGKMNQQIKQAAVKYNLRYKKIDLITKKGSLRGQIDDFFLSIIWGEGQKNTANHFTCTLTFKKPPDFYFSIENRSIMETLVEGGGKTPIKTGCPDFDRVFYLRTGQIERLLGLLSPSLRHDLLAVASWSDHDSLSLKRDALTVVFSNQPLEKVISMLKILAEEILRPGSGLKQLRFNYYKQKELFARLKDEKEFLPLINYLDTLLGHFSSFQDREALIEEALNHQDKRICLVGFKYRFRNIPVREKALEKLWLMGSSPFRVNVLTMLEGCTTGNTPEFLMKNYPLEEPKVRVAIAGFFERKPNSLAGDFLLRQLNGKEPAGIKKALIKALGECGAGSAIGVLKEISHPFLRSCAIRAMDRIKERLGLIAGKGWLSFSEALRGGELSHVESSDAGALSLEKEAAEEEPSS